MGKILRVDLTSGSIKDENLPEESWLRKLIGGQALASYILLKELPRAALICLAKNLIKLFCQIVISRPPLLRGEDMDSP